MSQAPSPLRWASRPLRGLEGPPAQLVAATSGPSLAWASPSGELFWQASEKSEPLALGPLGGGPVRALCLSPQGERLAWIGPSGVGCLAPAGGERHQLPESQNAAAITFAGPYLLCAPAQASGELHLLGSRDPAARRLPLGNLSLEELETALRDQGLSGATEVLALWVAIHAGWNEAENLLAPRLLKLRRRLRAASYHEGRGGLANLLVSLRGGEFLWVSRQNGSWQSQKLAAPRQENLAEGVATAHQGQIAARLESGRIGLWDAEGRVSTTFAPRGPGQPFTFLADGSLLVAAEGGQVDLWRLPSSAAGSAGDGAALACAGAHLASYALRCVSPAGNTSEPPLGQSIDLLTRLWRVGHYPPLLWVHDLLGLLAGGMVGPPAGVNPEAVPQAWQKALERLHQGQGLRRLRPQQPARPALETAVARLLAEGGSPAGLLPFRPPVGEEAQVAAALHRGAGAGGAFDPEALAPPIEAWEKKLAALDLEELRTLDRLGSAAVAMPLCLTDGLALDILPESVRAVLGALLRLLPREARPGKIRGQGSALKGFGGYGEISRKGQLDQLLPTEYAFRSLLPARVLQGDALYYGREAPPPRLQEATWLVLDGSASMLGDPLLMARAIAVAAARLAKRQVEVRYFDHQLGPAFPLERPADLWQLIHGQPQVPPPPAGALLQKTAAVWQALLRRLRARGEAEGRVHVVLISHEFLGAEESEVLVPALAEIAAVADLRLVMIQFPDMRPYFESMRGQKGFEAWMWRGPSLAPERPPWKVLQEKGVPVALVPVTRLWEAGD